VPVQRLLQLPCSIASDAEVTPGRSLFGMGDLGELAYSASGTGGPAGDFFEERHRIVVGEYVLDTRSYEVVTPTRGKVRLTPVQYELLHHLMSHPGEVFSSQRLLQDVWGYPTGTGDPATVRWHIKNLRAKLGDAGWIETVRGFGYRFSGILQ